MKRKKPLFTIITATHNRYHYLKNYTNLQKIKIIIKLNGLQEMMDQKIKQINL